MKSPQQYKENFLHKNRYTEAGLLKNYNGLLIYSKEHAQNNKNYINWLISDAKKHSLNLIFMLSEDITPQNMSKIDNLDFVINRSRDENISLFFEQFGIRVFNHSSVCRIGNNKLAAFAFVRNLNIDYLSIPIFTQKSYDYKKNISKYIIKPIDGHGGKGISIKNVSDISGEILYKNIVQQFHEDIITDTRFYIVGNQIKYTVRRNVTDKGLANYSQGASFHLDKPNPKELCIVNKILDNLNIDYAGIDLLTSKDGTIFFGEIEDVVGSRMLSTLGINNTTDLFFELIYNKINDKKNNRVR